MAVYNLSGLKTSPFNLSGVKLSKIYDLSGNAIMSEFDVSAQAIPITNMWKFFKVSDIANINYLSTEEAAIAFDDSDWENVIIPHDWAIRNDFNKSSLATHEGGYLDGGDAWYRLHIDVTEDMISDHTLLYFEGVYMDTRVFINGVQVGENHHGYNPFWIDIGDHIIIGDNVIAVQVKCMQPSSRWYSGAGIYRKVYLVSLEKSKISISDIMVTSPDLEYEYDGDVNTHVEFDLNTFDKISGNVTITVSIYPRNGNEIVGQTRSTIFEPESGRHDIVVKVNSPELWGIYKPNTYRASISIEGTDIEYRAGDIIFGYRFVRCDTTGMYLNGEKMKMYGFCMHHDLGCIGGEANRSAMERQLEILMECGCNAIRITHNPQDTMFLDLCRDKGLLCIEEFFDSWDYAKKQWDFTRHFRKHYKEVIRQVILRDRNNPSLIFYSLGNEITGASNYTQQEQADVVLMLTEEVHKYDTTRFVTMGEANPTKEGAIGSMPLVDVVGINYNDTNLAFGHDIGKPVYGSETTSTVATRGKYSHDYNSRWCNSYDEQKVSWGDFHSDVIRSTENCDYSCGMFVWTGFDYIGEPTPWYWDAFPAKNSFFGVVDMAGFPKDTYWLYMSRWTSKPTCHIVPYNLDFFSIGSQARVWVYTNAAKVVVEGMGSGPITRTIDQITNKLALDFGAVTVTDGLTLIATAYDENDNVIAADVAKRSVNEATKLMLTPYKPMVNCDTDDLAFITCEPLDDLGSRAFDFPTDVTFTVEGGSVLGVDNGNQACINNMRGNKIPIFCGKCLCVVSHDGNPGDMIINATATYTNKDGEMITVAGSCTVVKTKSYRRE